MYSRTALGLLAVSVDLGFVRMPGARVLDFGCGGGHLVSAFLGMDLDAYGADVARYWHDDAAGRLRTIPSDPYRLPFDDGYFDLVTSTSVFEHVQNPHECLVEIRRVLKPGGVTVNLFPGKWYLPTEPHTGVPLGNLIGSRLWLGLWAQLGVRNKFQKQMDRAQVVESNLRYLRTGVKYLSRREAVVLANEVFGNCGFATPEYVRYWHGGAAALGRRFPLPGYSSLLLHFRDALLFARRSEEPWSASADGQR